MSISGADPWPQRGRPAVPAVVVTPAVQGRSAAARSQGTSRGKERSVPVAAQGPLPSPTKSSMTAPGLVVNITDMLVARVVKSWHDTDV